MKAGFCGGQSIKFPGNEMKAVTSYLTWYKNNICCQPLNHLASLHMPLDDPLICLLLFYELLPY